MKRGAPLARKTPLARGDSKLARTGRLNPMSAKTRSNIPVRAAVRDDALRLAGNRCRMVELIPEIPCRGRLEVHEPQQRSIAPGSHLVLAKTMVGCSAHHHWIDDHIAEAHERGLLERSSFERDGGARRLR